MKTKVAMIGIGGFGKAHVNMISQLAEAGVLECRAFAETNPDLHRESYDKLTSIGALHYSDYQTMIKTHREVDFVVIVTPIPYHKPMSIFVLEQGINVLLEKPPAATIQELDEIIAAKRLSGKICAVNFQNTSGKAFRHMLSMIQDGHIGDVKNVTAVGMWKRTQDYYNRAFWAGSIVSNGAYVLDGGIHNALAHLLHNSLIAAGSGNPGAAAPKQVQAELYKGHDIESEDTSCIRILAKNGVTIHFYTTLCNESNDTPYIHVKGSGGEAHWPYQNILTIKGSDGAEQQFSFGEENLIRNMYMNMIEAVKEGESRLFAPIDACRSFLIAGNGAFASSGRTTKVPDSHLTIRQEDGTVATYIKDVRRIFQEASEQGKLFSELGVEWAVPSQVVDTSDFREFSLAAFDFQK